MTKLHKDTSIQDRISLTILKVLLPLMFIIFIMLSAVVIVGPKAEYNRLISLGVMGVTVLAVLELVRRGYVRIATHIYVVVSTTMILLGMILGAGIKAPAFSAATSMVVVVAVLYQGRYAIEYLITFFVATLGILVLDAFNVFEGVDTPAVIDVWALQVGYSVAAFYVVYISSKMLREVLRKNKEQMIEQQRSSQFMRTILNSIREAIITIDFDGEIFQINNSALEILGFDKDEIVHQKIYNLMSIEYPDGTPFNITEGRNEVEGLHIECNDGHTLRVNLSVSPLCDEKGVAQGVILVFLDITPEIRLKEKLSELNEVNSCGLLARGVAYDFNNMLSGILIASEILKEELEESQTQLVDLIHESAQNATEVAQKLVRRGLKKKGLISFEVNELVQDTLTFLSRTLSHSIVINKEIQAYDPIVFGNAGKVQNALINIAINASEAMLEKGELTVKTFLVTLDEVGCRSIKGTLIPGDYVAIEVGDTGGGIAEENISQIFDLGFSTKSRSKGIGLSIVYAAIEELKGGVSVVSKLEEGTVITLYLPLQDKKELLGQHARHTVQGNDELVLVVDDEETVCTAVKLLLEKLHYRVVVAPDALAGLKMVEDLPIDVVIVDMVMPGLTGKDFFDRIHKSHPEIPVILSSGVLHEKELGEMLRHGLSGFLRKPYDSYDLSEVVLRALR